MKKLYIQSSFLILCLFSTVLKTQAACNISVTLSSASVTVNVGASTGTITATPHNNAGAVTYAWMPCSTLNSSTGASIISTPLGSTTYTVTAFDANGCTATATVTVNVVDPTIPGSGGASTVAAAYTYSYSTGGGVFNSMAGATVLATNSGMTNTNYNIDLSGLSPAFNFVFPGGTFNQFGVNTNGYVFLGATAVATDNQPIASTDPCTGIISGWGVALQGRAGTSGSNSNIEYVVSGSSPSRTLTIQWTDVQFQSRGGSASQYFNMQIILYEADYHIDYIYSDQFSQFISGQVGNVQIGLRGATNADFLDRTGGGGSGFGWDPSQTSAGGANTSGVTFVGGAAASYIAGPDRITYTPSCIGTRTTVTPSGVTDLCTGGSVTLTASSGSSYAWYMNGTLTDSIGQTFSNITTAGTYAVLAAPSVGCGIPSYVTSVTTNATVAPSVAITSNPTPLCSANATFTATPTNGGCSPTYQWQVNGSTVNNIPLNAATYTDNALNPNDQVQVIMTTNALCASQATATSNTITDSLPVVAAIAGGATKVCVNSATAAFTDASTGGTWSIYSGTGTASITAGGVVTGLTSGTVTVAYTISSGFCSNAAATLLTVDALPTLPSLTGTENVCTNSTTQLNDVTTGGTWSSGTTSVATVNSSGLVAGVAVGSSIITYTTAADGNGCINSTTASVTVNGLPSVASITGTNKVCDNSTTQLSDVTTGGTWSSGTTSVATVNGSGLVTGVSSGSSLITYTTAADGNGCINSTTASVTVNALPTVASITGTDGLCINSTSQLSDVTTGGTWSSGTTSVATVNGTGLVTGVSSGSSIITYTTAADGNGCVNSSTASVTVNALPVVASITGTDGVCVNSTTQLNDVTTGGTWSSGTTSVATVNGSGLVAGVSAGSSLITYTTAADGNGCINSTIASVTVNALPVVASITGTANVCLNSTTQLSDATTGGTWSSGTTSVATVDGSGNVTGISGGTSVITYTTAANGNGCINSSTASVTVNALPGIASITGSDGLCINSTTQLNDATTGGTWSSGTTSVATVGGTGLVTGVSNGTSVITYTTPVNGSGCANSTTATVTVNALPVVASITGTLSVCTNATIQLGDATTGGTWSSGTTADATVDGSGVVTGIASGTSVITYTTAANGNGCMASTTASVTINQSPNASASNNTPLCAGGSVTLSSGGGAGYSWTGPGGFTSSQQDTGLVSALSASSGIYTVTVTGSNGCTSTSSTSVVVNLLPTATAGNNGPLCFGSALDLSSGGGTGYSWTGPNGFTSSQQNPNLAFTVSADSGIYTVTVTDANGCTATATDAVVIFPNVPTPTISISVDTLKCSTNPNYISYQWYADTTLISGATLPYLVVTASGNYNIRVTDNNDCSVAVGITVTITGIPALSGTNDNLFSLSPNPATNQLAIHASFLNDGEVVTVSVISMLGQIASPPALLQRKGQDAVIDVSTLPSGFYFLQMKTENGSFTKKFIKE